jgi:uncharacterized UPF0160 family protein
MPWKEHFFELEKELGIEDEHICLALYKDNTNDTWRVQAIPVSETSGFENRFDWAAFPIPDLFFLYNIIRMK